MPKIMASAGWRRITLVAGLLALVPTLLAAPAPALAANDWTAAIPLSTNSDDRATTPNIAIDKEGFSHVVWVGGEEGSWQVYYTNNRGGSFFRARIISNGEGNHTLPDIAVGNDGHVHVVAARLFADASEINYFESPDLGATWPNRIRNISNTDGNANEPTVATDSDGNVYFVWIDNRNSYYRLFYTLRINGVYGVTRQLTSRTFDKFPDMVVTGSEANRQVHIIYQGGRSGNSQNSNFDIYYLRAIAVGGPQPSFQQVSDPFQLSDRDERLFAFTPSITTDGNGNLFAAYNQIISGEREIYLQRSADSGANWTPPSNVTARYEKTFASYPNLVYHLSFGRPTVTLGWQEGQVDPDILNFEYYPDTNTTSATIDKLTSLSNVINVKFGGQPTLNRIAAVFHPKVGNSKVYYANRAISMDATPAIQNLGDLNFTNSARLTVTMTLDQGSSSPDELRYAFDRAPREGDTVIPFAREFQATAPTSDLCDRILYTQVRRTGGTFTTARSAPFRLDSDVRANVSATNPGAGDPGYTRVLTANVVVDGQPDCASLASTTPALPRNQAVSKPSFIGPLALAAGPDGPRTVSVEVVDSLGNRGTFARQILLDTRAPELRGGTLVVPTGTLRTVLTDLTVTGAVVDDGDGGYPSDFWGVEIANTTNPDIAATDASLRWSAVRALENPGDSNTIVIRDWSVVSGLGRPAGDPSLAEQPLGVLLRFIDGAGNPSSRVLRATVTLQSGYQTVRTNIPLVTRP